MRKSKHEIQKYKIVEMYSVLILIATIFMGIGHATISDTVMSIEGDVEAAVQDGVFITDVVYKENQGADTTNSNINYFLQTMLESKVVLGNTSSSTITYQVTIYNKTDKEQVFIGIVTDKEDSSLYSNKNIEYSLKTVNDLEGIEEYVTSIAPSSSITFPLTFKYKSGADINQNTLTSKLNFRFMEKPILNLSNENQTYLLENIYAGYTPREYEFTVTNFINLKTNEVPMEYNLEATIDSPLTVKLYNENGAEVTGKINVDVEEQETHKYVAKIIWDKTQGGPEYEGKEYKCKIAIKAKPTDTKYLEYTISKEFNINITTCSHNFVEGICSICGKEILWDGTSMEVPEIKDFNWDIYNGNQLNFLSEFVNNGLTEDMKQMLIENGYDETTVNINSDTTISLMEDLYLQNHDWTPIGKDAETSFDGIFEGNGHSIIGANISSSTDLLGIFGHVTGEVNNLTIKDSLIEATGTNNSGGIVGYLADTGEINNCHNVNTEVKGNASTGGIAGLSYGNIYESTNSGTITGEGTASQIGGIVGAAHKNIENCENSGAINATGNMAGGISGRVGEEGKILSSKNTGDVTISSTVAATYSFAGGISGVVVGHIENCSNYGTIVSQTAARWNRVGGIAAALGTSALNASVKQCSNFGDVSAIGYSTYLALAGGMVGDTTNLILIIDCYNSGNILGKDTTYTYVGGLVGRVQGTINIENCYSKGEVNKDIVTTAIGGIIGKMAGSYDGINNVYYYDALDNNIGAISGKDYEGYNALEIENIFNNFEGFNSWLTTNNNVDVNDVEVNDVEANDVEANDVEANDVEANDVETNNVETNNVETNNVETNNVETNNIETNNVETNNVETNNVETNNIETNDVDANNIDDSD